MKRKGSGTSRKAGTPARPGAARRGQLRDWRGEALSRIRALIEAADPLVVEERKWRDVPVWSHDGPICTGETYKDAVKLTFFKGARLEDATGLFNASLTGNARRAIDLHEGDGLDEAAFKALIRAAVALNSSTRGRSRARTPAGSSGERRRR